MTTTTKKTMTLEITKKGRKWLKGRKPNTNFEMEIEINSVSDSWEPGQTFEVSGEYVEESSRFGTVVKIFPKSKAEITAQNILAQIEKWLGWVEEKASEGYIYDKGFDKLIHLGILDYPVLKERADKARNCALLIKQQRQAEYEKQKIERRQEEQQRKAGQNQLRDEARVHRILFALSKTPPLNSPVHIDPWNRESKIIVFTGTGKSFYIGESDPSCYGSHLLGHEGERGCYYYYREATEDEIVRLETEERAEKERREAWRELDRIYKDIWNSGEFPQTATTEEIKGERVFLCSEDVLLVGGGHWITINNQYIWAVQNNSADGDNWGASNVGGTLACRIAFNQELADTILTMKLMIDEKLAS